MPLGKNDVERALEILGNASVQDAIRKICKGESFQISTSEVSDAAMEEGKNAKGQIAALNRKLEESEAKTSQLARQRDELQHDVVRLQSAIDAAKAEMRQQKSKILALQDANAELRSENAALREENENGLGGLKNLYEQFRSIPSAKRKKWENTISGDSLLQFAISGMQEGRMGSLWEIAFDAYKSGEHEQATILSNVFDRFFDLVNALYKKPKFVRLKIKVGEDYVAGGNVYGDRDSAPSGVVSRVILQGYSYANGEVVKRSYVHVEEE